jgi:hypothetical protein
MSFKDLGKTTGYRKVFESLLKKKTAILVALSQAFVATSMKK